MSDESEVTVAMVGPDDGTLVGRIVGRRYEVIEKIAEGGMGKIFRAIDFESKKTVVVKVLSSELKEGAWRERFELEAATIQRLEHPNTVRIYDAGVIPDGRPYLVMEFLDGPTLMDLIEKQRRLPAKRIVPIIQQVCAALQEAHSQALVHRDLKPTNIMLIKRAGVDEFVKVLDFGLVKDIEANHELTHQGVVLGSPTFMAPEQIRGTPVDPRTDVYALGVLLFGALSGVAPFANKSKTALMMMHLKDPVPTLAERAPGESFDAPLEWVVARCLEKEPSGRFANAGELGEALEWVCKAQRGEVLGLKLRIRDGHLNVSYDEERPPVVKPVSSGVKSVPKEWLPWLLAGASFLAVMTVGAVALVGLLVMGYLYLS